MALPVNQSNAGELDSFTIFLHAGLMTFGVLSWLTGYMAGDYKKLHHFWFSVHRWLGVGAAAFVAARLFHGLCGAESARFVNWVPYKRKRLEAVWEDIRAMLNFKLPLRGPRQGLAGLWEAFGLAVFTWMAATGFSLFLFLTPGQKAHGLVRLVKELHELGEWLVPIFLAGHLGAVGLHALAGDHRWRKIFFLKG